LFAQTTKCLLIFITKPIFMYSSMNTHFNLQWCYNSIYFYDNYDLLYRENSFRLPNVCVFDSLKQNKHHSEYLFKMQSKHFFSNEFIDLWRFQRKRDLYWTLTNGLRHRGGEDQPMVHNRPFGAKWRELFVILYPTDHNYLN
jgi:hypothetical protein